MIRRLLQRRDVFSWCLYDWANSAFVTSITTVLLLVYFLSLIPEDGKARIEWSGFV
jgi:UMF1 family MFS transporter